MADERKKKQAASDEDALANIDLDELMGEIPRKKTRPPRGAGGREEPEAFGAFEAPGEIGGEEFRLEIPKRDAGEERPQIRERIISPWEQPMEYEREPRAEEEWRPAMLAEAIPRLSVREHKTTVLLAFAVVYLVFIGALTYLFFFNTGLAFEKTAGAPGKNALVLKNNSLHRMSDVKVMARDERGVVKPALELKEFPPGASQAIELSSRPRDKNLELIATARYHQSVTARLSLEQLSRETRLRSSFRVPKIAFLGTAFQVRAEVCNEAPQAEPLEVQETHDEAAFGEQARGYKIQLAGRQCAEIVVPFTPTRVGKTTILFNIVSRDNTEKQEIPIEVRG